MSRVVTIGDLRNLIISYEANLGNIYNEMAVLDEQSAAIEARRVELRVIATKFEVDLTIAKECLDRRENVIDDETAAQMEEVQDACEADLKASGYLNVKFTESLHKKDEVSDDEDDLVPLDVRKTNSVEEMKISDALENATNATEPQKQKKIKKQKNQQTEQKPKKKSNEFKEVKKGKKRSVKKDESLKNDESLKKDESVKPTNGIFIHLVNKEVKTTVWEINQEAEFPTTEVEYIRDVFTNLFSEILGKPNTFEDTIYIKTDHEDYGRIAGTVSQQFETIEDATKVLNYIQNNVNNSKNLIGKIEYNLNRRDRERLL